MGCSLVQWSRRCQLEPGSSHDMFLTHMIFGFSPAFGFEWLESAQNEGEG
jgi:hypothetical protein